MLLDQAARSAATGAWEASGSNSVLMALSASKVLFFATNSPALEERLLDRLVRCGLDQRFVQLLERSHDLVGLLGVDQQRLHDEIKLAHGRRRLGQLQDMALQEKPRLVQQAQGDLLADRQDGAVDEDALAGLEGESHFGFHFRPS